MYRRSPYPAVGHVSSSRLTSLLLTVSAIMAYVAGELICQPGMGSPNVVEIFDVGDGITLTPGCTRLREPMVYITVEPSLQHIIRNWKSNTSERTYYWGYICEGNGTRAAQNYSTNLPLGLFGWTYGPFGVTNPVSLLVGTVCRFFGCYSYTYRNLIDSNDNDTRYVFDFNTTSCVIDVDECQEYSAGCEQECTDLRTGANSSYKCSCRKGFTLAGDLHNCTDVDECELGKDNCDQICSVDGDSGWFNCSCRDGFFLSQDGHTCTDIDECEMMNGTTLCETNTTGRQCNNTPGSYQCLCLEGFQFNVQQNTCTDIDECAANTSSLCQNICNNTVGSYHCACPKWYTEIGEDNCTAMDVCSELAVSCSRHSNCVNSPDSEEGYRCACDSGYRQDGESCTRKALVHIIWIVTLVLTTITILFIIFILIARHKYLKNKHDIMKKYSVLFKYQIRKEEIDPSHNPVPFTPVRKVSYTFSVVSTLETYDYPLTPTLLEPDEMSSTESSPEGSISYTPNGQLTIATPTDLESSKRELSPIIEGNEDSTAPVEKTEGENNNQTTDNEKHTSDATTVKAEVRGGFLNVEVANPSITVTAGQESSTFSGYIQDSGISCNSSSTTDTGCSEVKKSSWLEATNPGYITGSGEEVDSSSSGGYVESSEAFWGDLLPTKGEVDLMQSRPEAVSCEPEKSKEKPQEEEVVLETPRAITKEDLALHSDDSSNKQPTESKQNVPSMTDNSTSLPPHHPLTMSSSPGANDGYIPSNFSTASSGYGSEEGSSSSFSLKSRFFSVYSYVPDSNTAYGTSSNEGYVPSSLSTTSSGYYSSEASVCGSTPLHTGHKVPRLLPPDSYTDSVFCEETSTLCCKNRSPESVFPSSAACETLPSTIAAGESVTHTGHTSTSAGYVSYPTHHHENCSLPRETAVPPTLTECGGCKFNSHNTTLQSLHSKSLDHQVTSRSDLRHANHSKPHSSAIINPSLKDFSAGTTHSLLPPSKGVLPPSSEYIDSSSNSGYIVDPHSLLTTIPP